MITFEVIELDKLYHIEQNGLSRFLQDLNLPKDKAGSKEYKGNSI